MGVSGGEAPAPHYKSAVAEIANREPTRAKNTIKAPERSLKKRRRRADGRQRSQKARSKFEVKDRSEPTSLNSAVKVSGQYIWSKEVKL